MIKEYTFTIKGSCGHVYKRTFCFKNRKAAEPLIRKLETGVCPMCYEVYMNMKREEELQNT